MGLFGISDRQTRTRQERALLDVFDMPKSAHCQAEACKHLKDGETVTWPFVSRCRGTRGTYTATRTGDTVFVTREEKDY